MATFFARKYMRPLSNVGTTEKVLGFALLLLLCGIVTLMVVQSTTDETYLFNVEESALRDTLPTHAASVAAEMLPSPDGVTWRAKGDAEAIPSEDWPDALGTMYAEADAFGVRAVYRRRYCVSADPPGTLTTVICDMATPAHAFGLWRTRKPDGSDKLVAGQDGWLTTSPARAAFWDGRYYTELHANAESTTTLSAAATTIASRQLHFGRPFEAESMLPPQGRVPGSLRYFRRAAFGIDSLDNVFAVDLMGGVTAWVAPATPGIVENIVHQARSYPHPQNGYGETQPQPAAPLSGDAQGNAPTPAPLTIVPTPDGVMAVFTAGAHVLGATGPDRAAVIAVAMSAHALRAPFSGDPQGSAPRPTTATSDNPFPAPSAKDWHAPREVAHYTADNLYAKIDGRAAAYIQFNVVGMTFGTYYHQSDTQRTIDVYWYDMGEPTNALGMYGFELAHDATPLDIGTDGYQVGGAVFFWKAGSYVQVLPAGANENDTAVALKIARSIADNVSDEDQDLWAMSVLPSSGRVEGSFSFISQDAFGQDFLSDVFTIQYDVNGGRVTLFIHRAEDEQASKKLLGRYVDFFDHYGHVIWSDADAARDIVAGDVSGIVDVVFAKGRYLGGAAGATNPELAKRAAVAFFDELEAP